MWYGGAPRDESEPECWLLNCEFLLQDRRLSSSEWQISFSAAGEGCSVEAGELIDCSAKSVSDRERDKHVK